MTKTIKIAFDECISRWIYVSKIDFNSYSNGSVFVDIYDHFLENIDLLDVKSKAPKVGNQSSTKSKKTET